MDPVTHTLAGAALGGAFFKGSLGPHAGPLLALASNVPDLDAVVMLTRDRWAILRRRGCTHSLPLAPLWAFLFALLAHRLWPEAGLAACFAAGLAAIALHVLLDLINSFGVVLLWPFSDWRPEWACVFILDPALTALLGVPPLLSYIPALARWSVLLCRAALGLAAAYILFCAASRLRARLLLDERIAALDLKPEFSYVFPEPFGPHRWRGVVRVGRLYRVFLIHSLAGSVEPATTVETREGHPEVERVRLSEAGGRLEWFFKAPVWTVEGGGVAAHDLRFRSLLFKRGKPFLFRFERGEGGGP